ncbi:hypothetical protein ABIB82_001903 [Bradyrhizobium sp. i1.8.4]|uniref:hypothetical protein n=1 Tax=unclassified Bradyrhizobium TaxID=2631580 RepID=UPI003D23ACE0
MPFSRLLASAAIALIAASPVFSARATSLKFPIEAPLEKPHNPATKRGPAGWANLPDGATDQDGSLDEIRDVLGQGYNSLSRQKVSDCVTGWISAQAPTGFSPTYYLNLIKSSEQLKDEMSAEASVSGSIAGWTAKASAKYTSEHESNSNHEFLLVKVKSVSSRKILLHQAKVTTPVATALADETLSPEAVKAAQAKFFQGCGDSYVSGAEIGGEFVALLTYTAKDETDKSSFEAAFSASGMGFSADADFSKKASAFRSQMGLAMESTQVGGSGGPTANTVDAIMEYSLKFNSTLKPDNAALIGFQTDKYSKLGITTADYDDLKAQVDSLRTAQGQRDQYIHLIDGRQPTLTHYGIGDVHSADRQRLASEFDQGNALLATCAKTPASCRIPTSLSQFVAPAVYDVLTNDVGVFGNQAGWNVDHPKRHLAVSGIYCFGGDSCFVNGISKDDPNVWVAVQIDDGPVQRYLGPIALPDPKDGKIVRVIVKAIDTNYSDNSGSLTAVLY